MSLSVIRKHIKLLWHFVKLSISRELQYRTNYLSRQVLTIYWQAIRYAAMLLIANRFGSVAGWDRSMLITLVASAEIISCLMGMFTKRSLNRLPDEIIWGKYDSYLTKPANNLFLSTFNQFRLDRFFTLLISVGVIIYITPAVSFMTILIYILLAILSAATMYFIWIFFMAFNFFAGRLRDISPLLDNLSHNADYPYGAYRGFNPILFVLIVPFLLISTVPASFLVDKVDPTLTTAYLLMAAVIIIGSPLFWKYALSQYSSASS